MALITSYMSLNTLCKMGGLSTCDKDIGADGCSEFSIQRMIIRTGQSVNTPPSLITSGVNN